jgi:hypothetical protein
MSAMRQPKTFIGLAKRSFPFMFGGIWLVCGAPFLVVGIYTGFDTIRQEQGFRTYARVTDGMVLTKSIVRNKNDTSHRVGYRFTASDGSVVKSEATVGASLWDRLVERGPVRVTYLPDRARTNRIEEQGADWMLPLIFGGIGLLFVGLGGFVFFTGVNGILRELRLETTGTLTEALVLDVAPANVTFNGVPQWRVRYRYHDHRGRTRTGGSGVMTPEEARVWKAGDRAMARFDPRAPKKSVWVGRP